MRNKIIPYNPKLKAYARELRKNSTLAEVLLWQKIKQRGLGVQFHRQVPMLDFIVDFYCHEIMLAIEIDGASHEFRYQYDSKRQGELEKRGVKFVRFSDMDIKSNMFSVLLSLQEIVDRHLQNIPKVPSREQSKKNNSKRLKKTPLKSHFDKLNTSPREDSPMDFSFPKKEKLKSKKLIEQLFAEGKQHTNFPLKLIVLKNSFNDGAKVKTMVVAPKKNFRSAVKRNYIKRLLREAYRLNKHLVFNNIEGNYAFAILYLGREIPDYQIIDEKMKGLLDKFIKKTTHEQAS